MPTATRTRVRSSPYATGTGESSRAANAQPTGRNMRITRSRSASVVSSTDQHEEVRPRRVTRSQAGKAPAVQHLDKVIEDELENVDGSSAGGYTDQESDPEAIGGSQPARRIRRLQMRRSIVAQYEDNGRRSNIRSGVFGPPLTLEQRALRLRHDAGAVLEAILRNDVDSESPFAMDNGAKLTSLRAARQSILSNESFAHFLDRSALLTVPNFDPFEHSITLNSALRIANIAAFVRIVNAPAEAAESLEAEADKSASTALKEAWLRFFPLCVPKPWTGKTKIQLLVDMATQRVFSELSELQEPLMIEDRLHEKVEEALAVERFSELEGWSEEEAALNEKEDAIDLWNDITRLQLSILRRLKTLDSATQELTYEDFRAEMIAYINDVIDRLDIDEEPGQPSVLQDMPSGRVVEEEEELEEEEDAMVTEHEAARVDAANTTDEVAPDFNLTQAEFDELVKGHTQEDVAPDYNLTQAELDNPVRRYPSSHSSDDEEQESEELPEARGVPAKAELQEEAEEEIEERIEDAVVPLDGSQWAVREGSTAMPLAQAMAGGRPIENRDQRRILMEPAGPVDFDSQVAEASQAEKRPRRAQGRQARTRDSPAAPVTQPTDSRESREPTVDGRISENQFDGPANSDTREDARDTASASEDRQERRPRQRDRDHRAGHYAHQPDVDPPRRVIRETSHDRLSVEAETSSEAPPRASPIRHIGLSDDYLVDEAGRPLHDDDGKPLRLYKEYESMSNASMKQDNRAPEAEGHPYRAEMRMRWTREQGLFLYREVQKVPSGVTGQPTAYVYKRFRDEPAFKGRNSNQVRDKMKDMVKQRNKEKKLVVGAARHYLDRSDKRHIEYQEERSAAQSRLRAESSGRKRAAASAAAESQEEGEAGQEAEDEAEEDLGQDDESYRGEN